MKNSLVPKNMKAIIKRIPIIGDLVRRAYWRLVSPKHLPRQFPGSQRYWENRYATGGNSGVGSYEEFADFKAEIVNRFITEKDVQSVIELGCGDGNQLMLLKCPKYLGFDISETTVNKCRRLFAFDSTKTFGLMYNYAGQVADLILSLDVIYHLVEDQVFEDYMRTLFMVSNRYVIIYSSDFDDNSGHEGAHVRHRKFSEWIQHNLPNWKLLKHIPNRYSYKGDCKKGSFADFFIYEKA